MSSDDVNCVCFAPTGKYIASCSNDGTVRVWDAATGKLVGSPLTGDKPVACVAFSTDGSTIAAGEGYKRGSSEYHVRLYDVQTGEVKLTLTGHSNW